MKLKFLICGKRTGSTMFGRILDSHSSVACPFELAIPSLLGRGHWKYNVAVSKLRDIARHYRLSPRRLLPLPRVLARLLNRKDAMTRRGIVSFTQRVAQAEGKSLFIVKEPCHFEVIEKIVAMLAATR